LSYILISIELKQKSKGDLKLMALSRSVSAHYLN
jgi:hypothetical protein